MQSQWYKSKTHQNTTLSDGTTGDSPGSCGISVFSRLSFTSVWYLRLGTRRSGLRPHSAHGRVFGQCISTRCPPRSDQATTGQRPSLAFKDPGRLKGSSSHRWPGPSAKQATRRRGDKATACWPAHTGSLSRPLRGSPVPTSRPPRHRRHCSLPQGVLIALTAQDSLFATPWTTPRE